MIFTYVGHGYQIQQIDTWTENEDAVYAFTYPYLPVKITLLDDYRFSVPGEMPGILHNIDFGIVMSDDLNELIEYYNHCVQREIENLEERLSIAKQRFIKTI